MSSPKDARFAGAVEAACEAALIGVGFKRPRQGCIVYEINADFFGWIGLNRGMHAGFVRINPFVGIHCIPLMRLYTELEGRKYQKGAVATFAVHLGELSPSVAAFEFHQESDIETESRRLAEVVLEVGLPFMRAHASYDAILPILEERVPTLGGYPERVASALYLTGDIERARRFVSDRRAEYATKDAAVRASFDTFALPFLKLLNEARAQ